MRLEVGAGEHPDERYGVHTDVLALPGIEVICLLDRLPFADRTIVALRANQVLEHQSWELVGETLAEWARVLAPGAEVEISVPDARLLASQWADGELSTRDANHWIMGGHSEREAHRGVDDRGVPRWIWNAHHTLFDAAWLVELAEAAGMVDVTVEPYAERNLRCRARSRG